MKGILSLSLLCAASSITSFFLFVGDPCQSGEESQDARIARLLRDLDDASFLVRQNAERQLAEIGEPAVKPLKLKLADKPALEVAVRVQRLLQTLAIYDGGGPAVRGLKIRLDADKNEIRVGQEITLTTTLRNLTSAEMIVDLGDTPISGHPFLEGRGFRQVGAETATNFQTAKPNTPRNYADIEELGHCLTTVPSKSSRIFVLVGECVEEKGVGSGWHLKPKNLNPQDRCLVQASASGTFHFRIEHRVSEADCKDWEFQQKPRIARYRSFRELQLLFNDLEPVADGFPGNLGASYWSGAVQSNQLDIKLMK